MPKLTKAEKNRRLELIQPFLGAHVDILACDPAGQSKRQNRGFAWLRRHRVPDRAFNDFQVLQTCTTDPPQGRFDVAVVEGQYAAGTSSRQSLITLGFGAGYCLGIANAPLKLVVPVQAWKDALIPGFWNAPKHMYTGNLRQMFPGVENEHCLDAVGLGSTIARGLFSPEQLIEWIYD